MWDAVAGSQLTERVLIALVVAHAVVDVVTIIWTRRRPNEKDRGC